MGDITAETPKAMLPVRGRPMLEHVLDGLAAAGIRQFLIVVGYRREVIEDYFAVWRLPVTFRTQDPIDGTGSATQLGREFAGNDAFLVATADCLVAPDAYARCGQVLEQNPATVAVLGVKDVDDPWRAAAVYVDGQHRIQRVIEKPPQGSSTTRWSSAGLWSFRPVVFDYLARIGKSSRGEYEITSVFDLMLADGLELRISPIEGEWRDVGRPEDLDAVNKPPE
jgi:dTDP-glucose pyrophosphorylase